MDALTQFDGDSQAALFAHCASFTVNVVKEPWNRRPGALAHGDLLARAVNLDMTAAGWTPTVDNYLGRVPKARILEAVREAKGEEADPTLTRLTAEAISDADIHAACLAVVERSELPEEQGAAEFRASLAAIREAEQRLAPVG